MIVPVWTSDCDCHDPSICKAGFQPTWLDGPNAEDRAAAAHIKAFNHLQKYGAPTHWAYHANGRHLAAVVEA